jgi:hypothetical protein
MDEPRIGVIRHYWPRAQAAALDLDSMNLQVGDRVRIRGRDHEFVQTVKSMQVEHLPRIVGRPGDPLAIEVAEPVHENDEVYLVRDWHSPKE